MPVWPLAWQCLLGQNTVAGSMRCSFWLCVEACQEEYVGIPIFITSALHHGSGQRYHVSVFLFRFEVIGNGIDFVVNQAIDADMYQDVDEKLTEFSVCCFESMMMWVSPRYLMKAHTIQAVL